MKRMRSRIAFLTAFLAVNVVLGGVAFSQAPTPSDALRLTPRQPNIDYDQPTPDEVANCTLTGTEDGSGYVVRDGSGATLRMFLDTDGDRSVDQWRYYKDGLEIYRDIDSNQNKTVDQYRWFHSAGSRWGLDENEDGRIDGWRTISAEEATVEVVEALKARDAARFLCVALTAQELQSLRLSTETTASIATVLAEQSTAFQELAGSQQLVTNTTEWVQFSGNRPGLVPANGAGSQDVSYYANVVAFIQTGTEHDQVVIGNLVKVGLGWRVIGAPALGEDVIKPDLFMGEGGGGGDPPPPPVLEQLMSQLAEIEANLAQTNDLTAKAQLHTQRADVQMQIAAAYAENSEHEESNIWIRNTIDLISAAVQMGEYSDGLTKLTQLKTSLSSTDPALAVYAEYRYIRAEYGLRLIGQDPAYNTEDGQPDYDKILTDWLATLQQFVEDHPTAPESAEAMIELANNYEFSAQDAESIRWYEQIIAGFPNSVEAQKATGAIARLQSEGQVLAFSGKTADGQTIDLASHRGKVVLIQYWASWCEPCKTDIAVLKDLFARHGQGSFVVLSVNVDNEQASMDAFLATNRLPWTSIHEEGGLDSPPALRLGILNVPTMLLVDQQGRVVNRDIKTMELEREIAELIAP